MECAEVREHLSEYIDGFMDAETEARVRMHLMSCKDCAEELASLKAVVRELGDLEPVEAPGDFLARLHERMERPSALSKILDTLFRPFKIKIPLEFAGAAAAAVLVFIVLNVQQPREEMRYRALPEKQAEIARRVAPSAVSEPDRSAPPKREKFALRQAPAAPEQPALMKAPKPFAAVEDLKQAEAERRPAPIELALVIRTDRVRPDASALSAPSEPLESRPVETKMKKGVTVAGRARPKALEETPNAVDEGRETPAASGRAASSYKDQPLPSPEYPAALFPRVRELITIHQGKILSVEYEEGTQNPRSIVVDMPAERIGSFSDGLKALGDLQTPQPIPSEDAGGGMIRVHIRFLFP